MQNYFRHLRFEQLTTWPVMAALFVATLILLWAILTPGRRKT